MSATTTEVPTAMLLSWSNGMANHSSPRARTRPGLCPPRISRVTRAVSPTMPWTPLSTFTLYSAPDEAGLPLLEEGGQGLRGVLAGEIDGLAACLVLDRLLHR